MEKSNQKRKFGEFGKCIKCQKTFKLNIGISPCCDAMLKPIDLTFNPRPVVDVPKQVTTIVEIPRVKKKEFNSL